MVDWQGRPGSFLPRSPGVISPGASSHFLEETGTRVIFEKTRDKIKAATEINIARPVRNIGVIAIIALIIGVIGIILAVRK
jgi:hypothetical protein